jgi:DNA segregation ATPase FtsK/SpoIIIE, S-DNA-T family
VATSKRASSKTRKKGKGGNRGLTKARGWAGLLLAARDRAAETVTQEVIGGALLVAGLFFSAAFFSGRGAVLGEMGLLAATYLMGVVGLALAPIAVVCGLLLLIGLLSGRVALGIFLLLVAAATTLGAWVPRELRFSEEFYTDAGGALGNGVYSAVDWAGGAVGAALTLVVMYILGLSLITGITRRLHRGSALGREPSGPCAR